MRTSRGFTLVELLVVIAIIGILSSIVMVALGGAKEKSRDSKRLADMASIKLALALYYNDNYMYPKNIYGTGAAAPDSGLAPLYLPVVPRDPKANPAGEDCASNNVNSFASCYHYYGLKKSSGLCDAGAKSPVLYHLAAAFEDISNSALAQDIDADATLSNYGSGYSACGSPAPSSFDGNQPSCKTAALYNRSLPDPCYDVTP
mgnify:CR=1 FL=1